MKEYGKNCKVIKMKKTTMRIDDRITHSVRLAVKRANMHGTSLVFSDGDVVVERSPKTVSRDAVSGQFLSPRNSPSTHNSNQER